MLGGNLSGRTPFPPKALSQGYLRFSRVPAGQEALTGQTLIGAGALGPGTYVCRVATDGLANVDIYLMPSAVTGTFAPTANILRANGEAVRTTVAGTNFVAATPQTLALATLRGACLCEVRFTVPGGGSVTFDEGATKATPTAIAEYNGQ